MGHFVVFSNTVLCKEETNMAVASVMTCKIDLIWSHMKPSMNSMCKTKCSSPSAAGAVCLMCIELHVYNKCMLQVRLYYSQAASHSFCLFGSNHQAGALPIHRDKVKDLCNFSFLLFPISPFSSWVVICKVYPEQQNITNDALWDWKRAKKMHCG